MHNNYYFLNHLSQALGQRLLGMELLTCFSQNKNELVLGFALADQEFYINAVLDPGLCCLTFPTSYARSRKNSVNLFPEAIGLKVTGGHQYLNERSFLLQLENGYSILFKMHGNRSNLLLFKDKELISLFKNNLINDKRIILSELDRPLAQNYQQFLENECRFEPLFPTFGKVIKEYFAEKNFNGMNCPDRWKLIEGLLAEMSDPQFYISRTKAGISLMLIPWGDIVNIVANPIDACNVFYSIFSKENYIYKEKGDAVKLLEKKLAQSQNYVEKTEQKLKEITNSTKNEEIANIIMANMHLIPTKAAEVDLFNFYTDSTIRIKLKKELSPQKNAENFYRKAKNHKKEVEELENNLNRKRMQMGQILAHKSAITEIEDVKTLRKYLKVNELLRVENQQEEVLPYKKFEIEGFEVLVGKNAKSNDKLTQQFTGKDDLWLHAKDVRGSHVVVKQQPGKNFPKSVIEKAAQLAAFYSKRKTDSLCPVIFTPKKYVRKVKGAPEGSVRVEKEEVILVQPKGFS